MTKEDAKQIAEEHVDKLRHQIPIDIELDTETQEEHPLGYIFSYNSKDYLRTGDIENMLVGHGPLFVLRATGRLLQLAPNQSIDEALEEFSNI